MPPNHDRRGGHKKRGRPDGLTAWMQTAEWGDPSAPAHEAQDGLHGVGAQCDVAGVVVGARHGG